jgi:hypothetical protein
MARQIRSAEIRASAKAEIPVNDEEFYRWANNQVVGVQKLRHNIERVLIMLKPGCHLRKSACI